jgi:transcriptional regulator with XRE-family HTH domain
MKNRIRALRLDRKLTMQQLADAAGTSPQHIYRLETGRTTVSIDWLEKIAPALGVQPRDLLLGEEASGAPAEPAAAHGEDRFVNEVGQVLFLDAAALGMIQLWQEMTDLERRLLLAFLQSGFPHPKQTA